MCAFIPMLQTVSRALFTVMYKLMIHAVLLLLWDVLFVTD